MHFFVNKQSIVRRVWGKADTVLLIFAGAAAEFSLNKAVDWLYFTGRLPNDPIGRLFTTVTYARIIIFSEKEAACDAIDKMKAIHAKLEDSRGIFIPDWAYRDVLFMLIYYSIAAFELLERKLSDIEKEEIYQVFFDVGRRMGLSELPDNYSHWCLVREQHLQQNLERSTYTIDLFAQYKKHLGVFRYFLLKQGQILVVPKRVNDLLHLGRFSFLAPVIPFYKWSRILKLDGFLKSLILPSAYKKQIGRMDVVTNV